MRDRQRPPFNWRRCRRWLAVYIALQSLTTLVFHLNLNLTSIDVPPEWLLEYIGHPSVTNTRSSEPVAVVDSEQDRRAARAHVHSFRRLGKSPLKFLHIPKTAGTAIENAAGEYRIPWGSCLFNHKPKRPVCHYPDRFEWPRYIGWWHLPSQLFPVANMNPYQGAELFGVIRDPFDRLVSEFYYICTLVVTDWRPDQCNRTRLFDKEYMNQWLRDKLDHRDSTASSASGYYLEDNGHFTPQYEFIVGPHDVRMVDHVLRLDKDLSSEFARLMHAFELDDVTLKKINALGAQARDSQEHLTVEDLDDETVQLIQQLYPRDFDLGYTTRYDP